MAIKLRERKTGWRSILEGATWGVLLIFAMISVFTLVMVFIYLLTNSVPFFMKYSLSSFLTGTVWRPTQDVFGVLPLFVGTLMVSFVAAIIAVPIGLGCTIYLSEIAHPEVKKFLKPIIEILAGVPSVVFGLFAALVLSTWLAGIFNPVSRLNALNGAIIVAIMIVPILISIAEDALNTVPSSLKEASLALGANRWETIRRTILPAALPGIVAAIVLSIGRAVGETMAVIMATGSASQFTLNILASVTPMTAAIAMDIQETATGSDMYHALFAVGLLLFVITFSINLIADYIMARFREVYK